MIKSRFFYRVKYFLLQGFVLVTLSFALNSCSKTDPLDCFKATGDDITENRNSGEFNKIILRDNVNLIITQDTINKITVTAGDKIIDKVITRISDGALNIENNNTCNWVRSFDREIIVNVTVKELTQIEYRGSGDINSSNIIKSDSLVLNVWEGAGKVDLEIDVHRNYIYFHIGTADIFYKGNTHLSYITAASFGPVDAIELNNVFTYISNEGSNNCYVNTNLHLGATITSIGNIYYKGDPEISLNDTGEGALIKMD